MHRLGRGVERNEKKVKYFYELAAMKGNVMARHNIGCMEAEAGNEHRAMKHFLLAARAGYNKSDARDAVAEILARRGMT